LFLFTRLYRDALSTKRKQESQFKTAHFQMKPNFINNTLESMKTCRCNDSLPHMKGTNRSEGKPRRIV